MSTPPDPAHGQPQPGQPPYGTGYGGARYPYPGDQGQPPGQQPQGYPYNPYAQSSPYGGYPAGLDKAAEPVPRPGIMVLGLVLAIVAALPFLAFGVLFLVVPLDPSTLPPGVLDNPDIAATGITVETLVSILRVLGGIFVALALLYILFAALAFAGRNWSRILLAVMTGGFTLVLLFGVVSGGAADLASAAILLTPVVLSVAAVVVYFLPASSAFFAAPRR